ncbi:carbohydrate ABC transporter permease [Sphaerochaeta halotolerans]|jgi:raffinose/stachyose/melibiose transport system permease protein|uniref:Sugar ABC transporter permease n=1 Tax=Sphaerochaeta halotolerans TaxID=2293840 RepID=A0A372MJ31_9SPIR|nr:sugar ABC transporter permease [Sphaerochaeta halotolerans]MBG0766619.1 sugar ABC transporter permease [Spirochaetaceae bacterium]MDK2859051.1 fucose transport system permease protein [Sphaerochaeta sp.]MDN5332769.1 fucose transport system permease protein [Sphaerochaeta sp.]MXI85209.1 ABC transporter permease subunit [Sphaerochaeta halotolerans]RFU95792.1 sugar ABC transporter permease [Sphaerochaeta halotolerans]
MQAVGIRNRWIWSARILFLLPVALLFFFFFIYPFFFTVFTSFTSWRGIGAMKFNGIKNYTKLITDPTFQKALRNNIVWALSQGLIQVPLACLVAMILVRKPFGWRGLRTIYYLPNVISTVALAMVWVAIYNVDGPLNAILSGLFGMEKHNWLGNPDTALFAVIFQTVIYIGYFMIVLLASAMNIPRSLYEAAEIDGASTLVQEINITLPMLRGTLITTMTLAMAYGMRHFEATFLMTGGGPAYATTTMGIDLYLKMDALRYSEASTSGVFLIIMGTLVITLLRKLFGSSDPMSEMAQ